MPVVCSSCGDVLEADGNGHRVGKCCFVLPDAWQYDSANGTYTRPVDEPDSGEQAAWECEYCGSREVRAVERRTDYSRATMPAWDPDNAGWVISAYPDYDSNTDEWDVECVGCARSAGVRNDI